MRSKSAPHGGELTNGVLCFDSPGPCPDLHGPNLPSGLHGAGAVAGDWTVSCLSRFEILDVGSPWPDNLHHDCLESPKYSDTYTVPGQEGI